MHKSLYPLAALLLAAGTGPALAVDTPVVGVAPPVAADPFGDLYSAIEEGVDQQAALEQVLDTIIANVRREVPEIDLVEEARPGFLASLRADMLPVMSGYSERVRIAYRPKMIALLGQELTTDDAREAAAFYRSDLGRKLMAGAVQNFDLDETMRSAVKNPDAPIDPSAIDSDFKRMGVQAYLTLTPEERKQLDLITAQSTALGKLSALQPKIAAIRAEMESEPPSAEENAQLEKVIQSAFAKLG